MYFVPFNPLRGWHPRRGELDPGKHPSVRDSPLPYSPAGVCGASSRVDRGVEFALRANSTDKSPDVSFTSIGQTPTCGFVRSARSAACFAPPTTPFRCFFIEFLGIHTRSRRRIRQSRRKKAGFTASAQPSGHTSPVAALVRKFETG
jgi:hypothetical protein